MRLINAIIDFFVTLFTRKTKVERELLKQQRDLEKKHKQFEKQIKEIEDEKSSIDNNIDFLNDR